MSKKVKKIFFLITAIISILITAMIVICSGSIEAIIVGWMMIIYFVAMDKYTELTIMGEERND